MSFIDNIKENFDKDIFLKEPSFKVIIFGEDAIYLQGIKSVKYYNTEEICLEIKKGELQIKGKNLFIKKFCIGDMAICGEISELKRN